MKAVTTSRRDRVRAMLADLKMPGALEAVDGILAQADSGGTPGAHGYGLKPLPVAACWLIAYQYATSWKALGRGQRIKVPPPQSGCFAKLHQVIIPL